MKKSTKNQIREMRNFARRVPNMNESMSLNSCCEEDDFDEMAPEEPSMRPEEPVSGPSEMRRSDPSQLIDDIRKKALRAMADLADNPEDETYQTLSKIWKMCDRKPDSEKNRDI